MDKDNNLNAKETKVLLEKFTGHDADEDQVRQFLQNIDEDGDALIQLDELHHFIHKGITLSNEGEKATVQGDLYNMQYWSFLIAQLKN